jgi:hypothetical protein
MLEKALADLEKSICTLRPSLIEYLKVLGNLKNKNWAADVAKAKAATEKELALAKTRLRALQDLLRGTEAPQDQLMRMSNLVERLTLLMKKAEDLLSEPLVQSA